MSTKDYLKIVWVELDRRIPRYLSRSIKLHRRLYPDSELILLTNQEYDNKYLNQIVHTSKLTKSTLHKEFDSIKKDLSSHQKEFWINTTKRFYVLHDFLSSTALTSILHIESDVVLLDKDAAIGVDEIVRRKNRLAYPMYDKSAGSPGIVFVPNAATLESSLKFFLEHWRSKEMTDMKLLGLYRNKSITLNNGLCAEELYGFGGIPGTWDGGRLGQFFLGTDARNARLPISVRYKSELVPDIEEKANLERFRMRSSQTRLTLHDVGNFGLASIHIHNKLLPRTIFGLNLLLFAGLRFGKSGGLINAFRLDYVVFLERILGFIKRRVLRDSAEVNFR